MFSDEGPRGLEFGGGCPGLAELPRAAVHNVEEELDLNSRRYVVVRRCIGRWGIRGRGEVGISGVRVLSGVVTATGML